MKTKFILKDTTKCNHEFESQKGPTGKPIQRCSKCGKVKFAIRLTLDKYSKNKNIILN